MPGCFLVVPVFPEIPQSVYCHLIPVFNLYEEFWKIYTKNEWLRPQYIANSAVIDKAIMGDGCEVYGEVHNSVIGSNVVIEEGAVVRDSIVMNSTHIGKNTVLNKTIVAENTTVTRLNA